MTMSDPSAETFALLRQPRAELNSAKAAEVLAATLGRVRVDLQRELAERPGVLLRGLSADEAREAAGALDEIGVPTWVLPESKIVVPPRPVAIRHGKVEPEGFVFVDAHESKMAAWRNICYFDIVQILAAKNKIVVDREIRDSSGRQISPREVRQKVETKWQEFLDVVCFDPAVHLRIDRSDFRYTDSGLPTHADPAKNYLGLVIAFKTRCESAVEGPGVELLFDGKPDTHQRVANPRIYENLLQWRLTIRVCGLALQ
jgi:hypothetical protein